MTRDQGMVFLDDAGRTLDLRGISDNRSCITFGHRGRAVKLYTHENDPEFLKLRSLYKLPDRPRDELEVARTVARVQRNFRVVRLTTDVGLRCVAATAEQFLPDGPGFERTFWRTVNLVVQAARKAHREIDSIGVVQAARKPHRELHSIGVAQESPQWLKLFPDP